MDKCGLLPERNRIQCQFSSQLDFYTCKHEVMVGASSYVSLNSLNTFLILYQNNYKKIVFNDLSFDNWIRFSFSFV